MTNILDKIIEDKKSLKITKKTDALDSRKYNKSLNNLLNFKDKSNNKGVSLNKRLKASPSLENSEDFNHLNITECT